MPLIETAEGVANVDAIAAVKGVDMLWIGHFDLSASLGIPGQFDHPDFQNAVTRVIDAAGKQGKAAGYMALSPDEAVALNQRGFRCLAYSGDLWVYQQALQSGIAAIRSGIAPA